MSVPSLVADSMSESSEEIGDSMGVYRRQVATIEILTGANRSLAAANEKLKAELATVTAVVLALEEEVRQWKLHKIRE